MKKPDPKLLEKYIQGRCSPEEAEFVLDWFDTKEGRIWIEKAMDEDIEKLLQSREEAHTFPLHEPAPDILFNKIMDQIGTESAVSKPKRNRAMVFRLFFQIAAALLILVGAGFLFFLIEDGQKSEGLADAQKEIVTGYDEQRVLTLGDGSVIRLNSGSRLVIPDGYLNGNRDVKLEGEAFFEIAHNRESPFRVYAGISEVEVLGTSFNLKTAGETDRMELAVSEGLVALHSGTSGAESTTVIKKGQFAELNVRTGEVTVEEFGVENYLSWMSGKLVFDNMSLREVCAQLYRFFDTTCIAEDESFLEKRLTASFRSQSAESIIQAVALTLDLKVSFNRDTVTFKAGY